MLGKPKPLARFVIQVSVSGMVGLEHCCCVSFIVSVLRGHTCIVGVSKLDSDNVTLDQPQNKPDSANKTLGSSAEDS